MDRNKCFTRQEIERWLAIQSDDTLYCPECRSTLTEVGPVLKCLNKMCLMKEDIEDTAEWEQFAQGLPIHLKERYK